MIRIKVYIYKFLLADLVNGHKIVILELRKGDFREIFFNQFLQERMNRDQKILSQRIKLTKIITFSHYIGIKAEHHIRGSEFIIIRST